MDSIVNKFSSEFIAGFYRFNRREQIILLWGALAVMLYLLWQLVLAPIQQMTQMQIERNKSLAITVAQVQTLATTLLTSEAPKKTSKKGGSIAELVDRTLGAHGLRMSGFNPGSNGEVRLRLDSVSFSGLSRWLHELEFKHAVQVRELSMNLTSTPGLITVNVRLRKE